MKDKLTQLSFSSLEVLKKPLFLRWKYDKGFIFIPILILLAVDIIFVLSIKRFYVLSTTQFFLQLIFLAVFALLVIILARYISKSTPDFEYLVQKLPSKEIKKLNKDHYLTSSLPALIAITPLTELLNRYFIPKTASEEAFVFFGTDPYIYTTNHPVIIAYLSIRCFFIVILLFYPISTLIEYVFKFNRANKLSHKIQGLRELTRIEKELGKELNQDNIKSLYIGINQFIFLWKEQKGRYKTITFIGYMCLLPISFVVFAFSNATFGNMVEESIGTTTLLNFATVLTITGIILLFFSINREYGKKMVNMRKKALLRLHEVLSKYDVSTEDFTNDTIKIDNVFSALHELYGLPDSVISPEKIILSIISFIVTVYGFVQMFT